MQIQEFSNLINNPYFDFDVILVMTGSSTFEKTLQEHSFSDYFPDYIDNTKDRDKVVQFIRQKFFRQNSMVERSIYYHFTDVFNTSNVWVLWNAVHEILVRNSLKEKNLI